MAELIVNNYSASYKASKNKEDDSRIVKNVYLRVDSGDILGIVGESGSGKTTLAKGILNQLKLTEGEILLDGENLDDLPQKKISQKIQMIFQNPSGSFNPRLKIRSSLEEIRKIHYSGREDFDQNLLNLLKKTSIDEELLDRFPSQLSGGQLQRLSIVRALLIEPEFLIADEAVSALDVSIRGDILKLLENLHKELGIGILFISHDLNVVHHICNKIIVLYHGVIVEAGDTDDIYNNPQDEYTEPAIVNTYQDFVSIYGYKTVQERTLSLDEYNQNYYIYYDLHGGEFRQN
ncbi:MAG: ABC transporter ATP-binding protein, partial [Eubacterium sp.]|nr:ABC transporter ATP-binding protein [Eubacterium sp.]